MSTTLSTVTCVPHRGSGLVARLGGDLFMVVGGTPDAQAFLLRVCSEVVAKGGDGRSLVRALAGQATTRGDDMPPCAALAPSGNNLVVFLHGEAHAESGELFKLSGRESLAWVDRVVPWPLGSVTITLTGAGDADEGAYNLRDGAVPGAGLTLTSVDEGSDTAPDVPIVPPSADVVLPPEPAPWDPRAFEPQPVLQYEPVFPPQAEPVFEHASSAAEAAPTQQTSTGEWTPPAKAPAGWDETPAPSDHPGDAQRRSPEPSSIGAPDDEEDAVEAVDVEPLTLVGEPLLHERAHEGSQVRGVYCRNDHFNDARELFCTVCGVNIVEETPLLTSGPRPPLGALRLDDGSMFELDVEYVIGREPTSDDSVSRGRRRALVVDDDDKAVSRAHARIELRDWDVLLFDNGSANGTFVAAEGETTWQHVPPYQPYLLRDGTRILIGRRTMIYDARRTG
jgi:hypothetical protein